MLPSRIFFDDFLDDLTPSKEINKKMACDIYEDENNYCIEVDVPGFKKEDIKIENMIYEIRGKQVMLDSDLAKLYQVETKRINEAVKNNLKKFPERIS